MHPVLENRRLACYIIETDFKSIVMTTWMFILTVALAAVFVLLVVGLVIAILYYRWRLRDSHRTLTRFIRESLEMENKNEK